MGGQGRIYLASPTVPTGDGGALARRRLVKAGAVRMLLLVVHLRVRRRAGLVLRARRRRARRWRALVHVVAIVRAVHFVLEVRLRRR